MELAPQPSNYEPNLDAVLDPLHYLNMHDDHAKALAKDSGWEVHVKQRDGLPPSEVHGRDPRRLSFIIRNGFVAVVKQG